MTFFLTALAATKGEALINFFTFFGFTTNFLNFFSFLIFFQSVTLKTLKVGMRGDRLARLPVKSASECWIEHYGVCQLLINWVM